MFGKLCGLDRLCACGKVFGRKERNGLAAYPVQRAEFSPPHASRACFIVSRSFSCEPASA
jgi:hypothetical protein